MKTAVVDFIDGTTEEFEFETCDVNKDLIGFVVKNKYTKSIPIMAVKIITTFDSKPR